MDKTTHTDPRGSFWTFLDSAAEEQLFTSLERVLSYKGKIISKDLLSCVLRSTIGENCYYIKIYHRNGKGMRRFFGRGRAQGEWENLLYFASLGIPTPRLVAYGQSKRYGQLQQAVLITEEVKQANDLAALVKQQHQRFSDPD